MFLVSVPSFFPLQPEEPSSCFCFSFQTCSTCNWKSSRVLWLLFSSRKANSTNTSWQFYLDLALRHQITYTRYITAPENKWGWKGPLEILSLFNLSCFETCYSGLCPPRCWRPPSLETPKPPWISCANVWDHIMKTFFLVFK